MALDESRRAHYADVRAWSACVGLLVRFQAAEASLVLPRKEPLTRRPRLGADAPVIPKLIRKRNEELATAGAVDIRIGPSLHLAAVGVAIGGVLRDVVGALADNGSLGPALTGPAVGYGFVYHLEIGLLFAALIAIGPLARHASNQPHSIPTKFGIAEFPT